MSLRKYCAPYGRVKGCVKENVIVWQVKVETNEIGKSMGERQ